MTTGNSSSENSSTQVSSLPQVTEYSLLKLKENHFLLLDFQWLFDDFTAISHVDDKNKTPERLRSFMSLGVFIDHCLTQPDTEFIYALLQPSKEDNTMSDEQESELLSFAEGLYIEVQERVAVAIDNLYRDNPAVKESFESYNLVGFFMTTAVIALSTENLPVPAYPSFEESYGSFKVRDNEWSDKVRDNPILQTYVPFITGDCEPNPPVG